MTFGVKEVMVIAALAFGIVVTGCSSTPDASLAIAPPLRVYNTGEDYDCKFCFSRYELEFYYPQGIPKYTAARLQAGRDKEDEKPVESEKRHARVDNYSNFVCTWVPTLPSFLK